MLKTDLFQELKTRNLIANSTPELEEVLKSSAITLYLGIDPTSDSLHLGSLLGVITMKRFQNAGHIPVMLVGGATGMIGDPSGKSKERNLLTAEALQHNFDSIKSQIRNLMGDIPDADIRDNREWWADINFLDFLRDVGKHATINQMVAKDSIRSRMEGTEGISFTEFSYMMMQAYDFYWLNKEEDCSLQVGGSDQWGNITAGIDLIRRKSNKTAHGLVWPLVEGADGKKFGKTAGGTVWLDENKTSPYELYQYLLNLDDVTSAQLLYWLTLDPLEELNEILKGHRAMPEARRAQEHLAMTVTSYLHGQKAAADSYASAQMIFSGESLSAEQIESLRGSIGEMTIPDSEMVGEEALVMLLVKSQLCSSKSDARRQLEQGAIAINGVKTASSSLDKVQPIEGKYILLSRGKKKRYLIVVSA